MNNCGNYLSPAQAKDFGDAHGDAHELEYWRDIAGKRIGTCANCGEPEWRYGQCGLCFTCTTGQADASEDSEIAE